MPKNVTGGKGAKSQAARRAKTLNEEAALIYPSNKNGMPLHIQRICIVEKVLGNRMYALRDCQTMSELKGSIRKNDHGIRRKLKLGSLVYGHGMEGTAEIKLIYITHVYDTSEIVKLKNLQCIPSDFGDEEDVKAICFGSEKNQEQQCGDEEEEIIVDDI